MNMTNPKLICKMLRPVVQIDIGLSEFIPQHFDVAQPKAANPGAEDFGDSLLDREISGSLRVILSDQLLFPDGKTTCKKVPLRQAFSTRSISIISVPIPMTMPLSLCAVVVIAADIVRQTHQTFR